MFANTARRAFFFPAVASVACNWIAGTLSPAAAQINYDSLSILEERLAAELGDVRHRRSAPPGLSRKPIHFFLPVRVLASSGRRA